MIQIRQVDVGSRILMWLIHTTQNLRFLNSQTYL